MNIEEKRKQRFQFLHKLYELTDGDLMDFQDGLEIGKDLGFPDNLTWKIAEYLKGEDLIKIESNQCSVRITHWGVKEIEEEIKMEFKSVIDAFLRKLWDLTEGDELEVRDMWEIGKELGYSNADTRKIGQYLRGEGHIRDRTDQGEISITHNGIKALGEKKNIKVNTEKSEADPKKVFVVHGRNIKAKDAIFDLLRSVHLEPIEWGEAIKMTGKTSPYPQEVLDAAFKHAQSIVVLITGDDLARLRREYIIPRDQDFEGNLTPQARPNVIFEAGLAFGRNPDRTILVELENEETRPFSDVQGRLVVRLSNEPTSRHAFISRLKTAGCKIDIDDKSDWIKKGDFDGAVLAIKPDAHEISELENKKKDDQEIEIRDEYYWILTEIANHGDDPQDKSVLYRGFKEKFPDKDNIDFQIIIDELNHNNSIYSGKPYLGGEVFYIIKSKGLKILKEWRKKKE